MITIKDARESITDILSAELDGIPVYSYPPNNIVPPAAFIALGASTQQVTAHRWDAAMMVTLVAPGGDNLAAVEWLESSLLGCAAAISDGLTLPVVWEEPGQTVIAGTVYLAGRLRVPIDLET